MTARRRVQPVRLGSPAPPPPDLDVEPPEPTLPHVARGELAELVACLHAWRADIVQIRDELAASRALTVKQLAQLDGRIAAMDAAMDQRIRALERNQDRVVTLAKAGGWMLPALIGTGAFLLAYGASHPEFRSVFP